MPDVVKVNDGSIGGPHAQLVNLSVENDARSFHGKTDQRLGQMARLVMACVGQQAHPVGCR